jgi:hypothetical protein
MLVPQWRRRARFPFIGAALASNRMRTIAAMTGRAARAKVSWPKDVGRMGSNGQSSFQEKFVDWPRTIWENGSRKY